ncbi:DUF6232 family protein [Brytella acorum]|uniref:DUF6232 family protein n=1 Tax=Brytella acorum TaxID=2959299 RepID=UPI0038CFDAB4
MGERILYSEGSVIVSDALVRIGSSSYALANIGSVNISRQTTGAAWLGIFFFGALELAVCNYAFSSPKDELVSSGNVYWIIVPVGLLLLSCLVNAIRPRYYLMFRTSSSDQKVFESRDYSDLGSIKYAIEQAIISRSK